MLDLSGAHRSKDTLHCKSGNHYRARFSVQYLKPRQNSLGVARTMPLLVNTNFGVDLRPKAFSFYKEHLEKGQKKTGNELPPGKGTN
jgi:hypothetical protein